jgi:hypothetical protein
LPGVQIKRTLSGNADRVSSNVVGGVYINLKTGHGSHPIKVGKSIPEFTVRFSSRVYSAGSATETFSYIHSSPSEGTHKGESNYNLQSVVKLTRYTVTAVSGGT